MNKNNLVIAICSCILLFAFYACNRDYTPKAPFQVPDGSSYLHIIDASPNFRLVNSKPDTFNVLVNGVKVTGYVPGGTPLMTYGSTFPTASALYGYLAIPSGIQEIKLASGVLQPDSVLIKSFTKTLMPNTYYTLLVTDSINSTKDSAQMFVRDSITKPSIGYFNLRFIDAVWNDTTGKTIDIWSTRSNRNIYANVKPGTVTGFAQYAFNAQLADTLYVRRAGTMFNLATLNGVSFSNQRVYTLYYKGDANLTSGTKARGLATYVHQ